MLIKDILNRSKICVSFEFFPPKVDAGWDKLYHTISDLVPLKPAYVSVTYGAGGSTRSHTHDLVVRIRRESRLTVVAHLTCVASTRDEIRAILDKYYENGVENIMALRGDPPRDTPELARASDFPHASDLVQFIKKEYPSMGIGVAGFPEGHPETANRLAEIDYLKMKVDSGADYIVTQLFFDNRDFYDFCERCELAGITVPIIAGIMPITTRKGMIRMADLAAGARIPARLLKAVARAESDEYVEKVGIHWATEQVRDLIDNNTKGIHLYTLNSSNASLRICEFLGLKDYMRLLA